MCTTSLKLVLKVSVLSHLPSSKMLLSRAHCPGTTKRPLLHRAHKVRAGKNLMQELSCLIGDSESLL